MSRLLVVLAGLLAWAAMASAQTSRRPWVDPIDAPPVVRSSPDAETTESIEFVPEVQDSAITGLERRLQPNGCVTRSYLVLSGKEIRVHAC
jgi:hypothetical protein